MEEENVVRFEWRDVNDLPFAYTSIFTVCIVLTVWKLVKGRFLVLPPNLMKYEFIRFITLVRYPRENKPDLISIAAAGFYHDGNEQSLVCYLCGLTINNITRNECPLQFHHEKAPRCVFFRRNQENNHRCFKGTEFESDYFRNVSNEEPNPLERLNNFTCNAVEIVPEISEIHENESEISSDDSIFSEEEIAEDDDHFYDALPTLPIPANIPAGIPPEAYLEYNQENVNTEHDALDLNVNPVDDGRRSPLSVTSEFDRNNSSTPQTETSVVIVNESIETEMIQEDRHENDQRESNLSAERMTDEVLYQEQQDDFLTDNTRVDVNSLDKSATRQNDHIQNCQHHENKRQTSFDTQSSVPCFVEDRYGKSTSSTPDFASNSSAYPAPDDVSLQSEIYAGSTPFMKVHRIVSNDLQKVLSRRYFQGVQTRLHNLTRAYDSYVDRIKSFKAWRKENLIKSTDLAAAGFFYTGNEDEVKCFQCGQE